MDPEILQTLGAGVVLFLAAYSIAAIVRFTITLIDAIRKSTKSQ